MRRPEEIVINTAGAQVDVGANFGGSYNAIFKSGSNTWHGGGWYFFGANSLNANSWQNNRNELDAEHDRKADAPSGTAVATAARLEAGRQDRAVESAELEQGARGARVAGVPVHSVRLPGLLAHQEVLLGNPGEVLTIRHDSTDRVSFVPGILRAIRGVGSLPAGVTVGLDAVL